MPEFKILVGENSISLKQLRERLGKTQTEVGQDMGISQSSVAKLERQLNPRMSSVKRFVSALGGVTKASVMWKDGSVQKINI